MRRIPTKDGKGATLLLDTESGHDECWTPDGAIDVMWHDGAVYVEQYVNVRPGYMTGHHLGTRVTL